MMKINDRFGQLADAETISRAATALKQNGIEAVIVENSAQAKQKLLALLPENAEVMNMTSMTLETISVVTEVLASGRYRPVRKTFEQMDKEQKREKAKLGAAPEYVVGSVHAVTEDGRVLVASNTGSQLPAYAYGSAKVIWVIGAQKIVKDFDEAMKRLYEYALPLEDERARKAYGTGSNVSKILIINNEVKPDRITAIIVKEKLGF